MQEIAQINTHFCVIFAAPLVQTGFRIQIDVIMTSTTLEGRGCDFGGFAGYNTLNDFWPLLLFLHNLSSMLFLHFLFLCSFSFLFISLNDYFFILDFHDIWAVLINDTFMIIFLTQPLRYFSPSIIHYTVFWITYCWFFIPPRIFIAHASMLSCFHFFFHFSTHFLHRSSTIFFHFLSFFISFLFHSYHFLINSLSIPYHPYQFPLWLYGHSLSYRGQVPQNEWFHESVQTKKILQDMFHLSLFFAWWVFLDCFDCFDCFVACSWSSLIAPLSERGFVSWYRGTWKIYRRTTHHNHTNMFLHVILQRFISLFHGRSVFLVQIFKFLCSVLIGVISLGHLNIFKKI